MSITSEDIQILPRENASIMPFEWGELTWYASAELGNSDEVTVGRCLLNPGESNPRHYHPNCAEILVVLEGRIRHTAANDGTKEMSVGDTVTIPANVWHQAVNTGDSNALLLIVFTSANRETIGE